MACAGWVDTGLVFKAHRLVYHSTLGLRVIKKKGRHRLGHRQAPEQLAEPRVVVALGRVQRPHEMQLPQPLERHAHRAPGVDQALRLQVARERCNAWRARVCAGCGVQGLQGYLSHKKLPPPRTLQ